LKVPEAGSVREFIKQVSLGLNGIKKPGMMLSHAFSAVSAEGRALADEYHLTYSGSGIHLGLKALAHVFRQQGFRTSTVPAVPPAAIGSARPRAEREVLEHLARYGVTVVPGTLVTAASQAAATARTFDSPVALKIVSADIQHKTEVGGVALDLRGDAAVAAAFDEMMTRVKARQPRAQLDGVMISPMRKGGVELFVGTLRDPQWGPCIAVGLGGVWVEALKDTSLRLLPVQVEDVLEMLKELRGSALLDGFRGAPTIDRAAVARAVVGIGNAALALGPGLVALEVNPLLASAERIEALDGLTVWNDTP
jgi:succinyl-CoA synthetase beta subunit